MTDLERNPCQSCGLKDLCISQGLSAQDQLSLSQVIRQPRPMADGSAVYWQGDAFHALYAVRNGAVKTVSRDADGQERVRGFFLPGDVIGLDALHAGTYPATAETLGETRLCVLSRHAIDKLFAEMPAFSRRVVGLMSRDLAQSLSLAGEYTADQRLAAFVLGLSARVGQRTGGYNKISLEMSRADIANYLRLVPETVSRVLGRFSKDKVIGVRRRDLEILDRTELVRRAGPLIDEPTLAGHQAARAA